MMHKMVKIGVHLWKLSQNYNGYHFLEHSVGYLDVCNVLIVTFLQFLPVLSLLLPLKLFVYLCLIIGILSLCISAPLTVLLLLNPVLNLTFSLLPITSSHSYTSTSDSALDCWHYINI